MTIYSVSGININSAAITGTAAISANDKSKKHIEEKENNNANIVNTEETREQKLLQRLKALASKLGIIISENEKISTIIAKIQKKINEIEDKDPNNSNINAIKSEFESIKQAYKNMLTGNNELLCGMEVLAQSNKASMGI